MWIDDPPKRKPWWRKKEPNYQSLPQPNPPRPNPPQPSPPLPNPPRPNPPQPSPPLPNPLRPNPPQPNPPQPNPLRPIPPQQNAGSVHVSAYPNHSQNKTATSQHGASQSRCATVTLLDVQGRPSRKLYEGQILTIGRAPERCELVDNGDKYISKEHCKISLNLAEGCFYVTDISANGTFYETGVQLRRQEPTRIIGNAVIFLATKKHRVSLQISG